MRNNVFLKTEWKIIDSFANNLMTWGKQVYLSFPLHPKEIYVRLLLPETLARQLQTDVRQQQLHMTVKHQFINV